MDTQGKNEVVAEPEKLMRKYCPIDGSILARIVVDNIDGWQCPECEYFEPIL